MSVSRSAQCLFSKRLVPRAVQFAPQRELHTSNALWQRRRPRFTSISADEVKRRLGASPDADEKDLFKPYTKEEKQRLAKQYTPEQLEAIKAGEAAIDPKDLAHQATLRTDLYRLPYLDDLSTVRPLVDRHSQPAVPYDPETRLLEYEKALKEDEENKRKQLAYVLEKSGDKGLSDQDLERMRKLFESSPSMKLRPTDPQFPLEREMASDEDEKVNKSSPAVSLDGLLEPDLEDLLSSDTREKSLQRLRSMQHLQNPQQVDTVAPELPKIPEFEGRYKKETADMKRDPDGRYERLSVVTGREVEELLGLRVKILVAHRVVNQTRLGKIQSMYYLCIAGNGNGQLGIGEGKAVDAEEAMEKAKLAAIRNMKPVPRYEGRTIYGDLDAKVSAVRVQLFTKPPGYGLRCQHLIFELARAVGISDLGARVPGCRNKMNTVKAAYHALVNQKLPEDVAMGRGKKLVDVRKVYYGGKQLKGMENWSRPARA